MALSLSCSHVFLLLTYFLDLFACTISLSPWWFPGQNVGPGEERDSGM